MRLIDTDAFKKYIIKGFEEMKSQFKTEFYLDIATRVTESFLEDIDEQPTVEAQPIEECEENGSPWCLGHCPYNTDVQSCEDCISRKAVIELIGGDYGKWLPQAIMELPPVTHRTNLAETSQDCISILNRIMEYTYGMLTAEKIGLQHLIKSMMDELSGGDSE